ncbi:MAG: SpoIIE family protein phosphatase [Zoogloea sp.]|uniref:SpoIIE family protein phosphatase n=1 Tax=Zoogloea sp. TaxID=49181 RepID=UPI003F3564C3
MLNFLLAPTIWISSRLRFSRKYALIGAVVLAALALLSVPLLRQASGNIAQAELERDGLRIYSTQIDVLFRLIELRSASVKGPLDRRLVRDLSVDIEQLQKAPRMNGGEAGQRLMQNWQQIEGLREDDDKQRRFAALTGTINALLTLIRENARVYRLNVDSQLDASFDTLAIRLPLIAETLAKQQDALNLRSGEMANYALGAQVVLSESSAGLKGQMSQLIKARPEAGKLLLTLTEMQKGIFNQQDVADKTLDDPQALNEMHTVATENQRIARALINDIAAQADLALSDRIEALKSSQLIVAALLVVTLGAIAYLFAGIYLSTLRSLRSLSQGTQAFCAGRLDTRIRIDTRDELVLVAGNFNTLATEFERLVEVIREQNESRQKELEALVAIRTSELAEKNDALSAANGRVQEELMLARNMQLAILPQHFPDEKTWSVHASMFPARELGGDFYDCFPLPDGRYGVLVADVSGKGVGAAFFMAVSRTVILDLATTGQSPGKVLAQANDLLCARNPMDLFVTACYAIFDPASGILVYASAGHHSPLLRRPNGRVEPLPCSQDIALGCMPEMHYHEEKALMAEGDTLLLYTDGVTEAFSAKGEAYGDERLLRWFASVKQTESAAAVIDSLVRDVAAFVNGAEASDDLTCLILRRKSGSLAEWT